MNNKLYVGNLSFDTTQTGLTGGLERDLLLVLFGTDDLEGDVPGAGGTETEKGVFVTLDAREATVAVLLGRCRERPLLRATRRKDGDQNRSDKDAEVQSRHDGLHGYPIFPMPEGTPYR